MIYVGLIDFSGAARDASHSVRSVVSSYTSPTVITKNNLLIAYGKRSVNNDTDLALENSFSVVLGRVFDKEKNAPLAKEGFDTLSLSDKLPEKIWGKYVYINVGTCFVNVFVDITGQLPFFYYVFDNGNVLFSSDIEIIFKILKEEPTWDWTYLCSYLRYGDTSAVSTPFNDVYEVPPGCHLKITKNERILKPFWDPLSFCRAEGLHQSEEKKDVVDVIQATLRPLIAPYKNVCVNLSGGLDSSSLVYCLSSLRKKGQKLRAQTHFHSNIRSSNELVYARKVCEETEVELVEIDVSQFLPFSPITKTPIVSPNKPCSGLIGSGQLEEMSRYIASDDSCIFLSGHGSDHIFMRPPTRKSVSDYFLELGLRGIREKIEDTAHFYRDTFFSVIRTNALALFSYFTSRGFDTRRIWNDRPAKWISKNLSKQCSTRFRHPVYEHLSSRIVPGKCEQIKSLYDAIASIQVELDPLYPTHYPFLCEPLLKFTLSLPTYDLFNKRYDRYPLRRSVSDRFKTETVWRRDKGETTGVFQLGVKENLDYVMTICLEGQFVKQNFVDKEALRETVLLISNGDTDNLWFFLRLISTEIFFKIWEQR